MIKKNSFTVRTTVKTKNFNKGVSTEIKIVVFVISTIGVKYIKGVAKKTS